MVKAAQQKRGENKPLYQLSNLLLDTMSHNTAGSTDNTQDGDNENQFPERRHQQTELTRLLNQSKASHVYLYGPRGSGKTAITTHLLENQFSSADTVYISCLDADSQYKALTQLCAYTAGDEPKAGLHTSELKLTFEQHIDSERPTIVVLDEIDFLLANDGDDLLYYLSRIDLDTPVNTVCISANHEELTAVVDDRTYSSLHPEHIHFPPYTTDQLATLLHRHFDTTTDNALLTPQAIDLLGSHTANARFAVIWLRQALKQTTATVGLDSLDAVRSEAVERYRDRMLQDFTPHHHLLLEALHHQVSHPDDSVFAGAVYDCYEDLCTSINRDPLTRRRLGDYLTHLELLGLITAQRHRGGSKGKTRELSLVASF